MRTKAIWFFLGALSLWAFCKYVAPRVTRGLDHVRESSV